MENTLCRIGAVCLQLNHPHANPVKEAHNVIQFSNVRASALGQIEWREFSRPCDMHGNLLIQRRLRLIETSIIVARIDHFAQSQS
jgi:hypothetical protein